MRKVSVDFPTVLFLKFEDKALKWESCEIQLLEVPTSKSTANDQPKGHQQPSVHT